jgi:hypothetical protein
MLREVRGDAAVRQHGVRSEEAIVGVNEVEVEEVGGAPTRVCAACGHDEDDHQVEETELAGRTERSTYCTACGAFHDFVAGEED